VTGVDNSEEMWVAGANADLRIRLRNLTEMRKRGVTVITAQMIEQTDETWTIWVRLSDRPGEFRLNMSRADEPRRYRDVQNAFDALRNDLDYWGPVICLSERRPAPEQRENQTAERDGRG